MTRILSIALLTLFTITNARNAMAQTHQDDIPVENLPAEIRAVLERYVQILRASPTLDEAAAKVVEVCGGSLVNDDGRTLRSTVKPFSLKKDHSNLKHYADPIHITRVNVGAPSTDGYGASAIRGKRYKVWIGKRDGVNGMPAPITIVLPEGHPTIKSPKVVNIGSL